MPAARKKAPLKNPKRPYIPPEELVGDDRPLLMKKDVCRSLRIGLNSVNKLIASGRLPVIRIGRSVRIHPETIVAFKSSVLTP